MPPLKETRLQIQERHRREIRQRTNKRLAELAQEASNRQGSSKTLQEDNIEDETEDQIEENIEDKIVVVRVDKIEGSSVRCLSVRCVVFLVILSSFVWSVIFRAL
jgi:hypothetical protein